MARARVKATANVWRHKAYDERRLLLLGESPYSWLDEKGRRVDPSPRHSIELVEGQINGSWPNKFMDTLTRGLTRKLEPVREEIAA
jgi:hypothetical protein